MKKGVDMRLGYNIGEPTRKRKVVVACAAREAGVVVGLRSADVPALNATHALSRKL